jgi:hypothetical protein
MIVLALCVATQVLAVPKEVNEDLRKPKITRVDKSVATMPSGLKKSLKDLFRQRVLAIADSGRPYRDSDFVLDPAKEKLPTRRLALAFATPRFYYVYYRAGGYEDAGKLLVFRIMDGTYKFIWGGAEFEDDPTSPEEIIKRVRRKSFDDSKKFFW